MSRRRRTDEVGFGSDSFLDIIANIVGILIILIVVAGMRVSQAPLPILADTAGNATGCAASTESKEPGICEANLIAGDPQRDAPPTRPVAAPRPSPGLVRQIARLEQEIAVMESEAAARGDERQRALAQRSDIENKLEATGAAVAAEQDALQRSKSRLKRLHGELNAKRAELITLQTRLDQARRGKEPVKQITHRLTPISREVEGKEIHFRLAENRVAYLPIQELVERLRPQMQRQKDWLVNYRQHQGQVGPVGGFMMNYVIERQPFSVLDELRTGRVMIRIGLTKWELVPSPNLVAETTDEALKMGSAFIRKLKAADLDSTVTLWVYPDSYPIFRRLQKFAHNEGFTVAARPLPFGVPIAGSPNGTRSAAQ